VPADAQFAAGWNASLVAMHRALPHWDAWRALGGVGDPWAQGSCPQPPPPPPPPPLSPWLAALAPFRAHCARTPRPALAALAPPVSTRYARSRLAALALGSLHSPSVRCISSCNTLE